MNRRSFVLGGGAAVMAASTGLSLLSRGATAAPSPGSFGTTLASVEQLAIAYFGPGGLGSLSWFTPTGPNPAPVVNDVLGSAAFHADLRAALEAGLAGSPNTQPIYDELIALYEVSGYAEARAHELFGSGTAAQSFVEVFRNSGLADLGQALGTLMRVDAAGLSGRVVATAVHLLGALGFNVRDAKDIVDEALGDLDDVQIRGSIAAAATLSSINRGNGLIVVTSSDPGDSTDPKASRKRWSLGKILGFIASVVVGSLIGGLVTGGSAAGMAAGGTLGAAIFLTATGGGGHGFYSPPGSPCARPWPIVLC